MSSGTSLTAVSKRDIERLGRNIARELSKLHNQNASMAICLDALLEVLDEKVGPGKVSDALKAKLAAKQKKPELK